MKKLRVLVLSLSLLLGSSMYVSADTSPKEGIIIKHEESKKAKESNLENVKVKAPITIKFQNQIDTSDKNCVYVFEKDSNKLIDINVSFGEDEKELVITPKEEYKYDTEYKVYIVSLNYKDTSSSISHTYNFKIERNLEKKEGKNVAANIEKKDVKVEKKTEAKQNTVVDKKQKSLEEKVKDLAEEISKLPVQFEGIGPDFRIDVKYTELFPGALEKKIPKEDEWAWISDKMRKELYEYPYWKVIESSFWTNKKLYNNEPGPTSYAMPGKYRIQNTYIPLAKGYFESKYTYDYRKQEENMLSVLPYTKSGCPLGYDEKEDKELFPDDIYKRYLKKFENEKIVSTAEFITDDSLVYISLGDYIIRGTLRIKYIDGTSQEFLDKYKLKKDTWYEIDKEVGFSNMIEDTKMWHRWASKSVYTMSSEYSLSGLRVSKIKVKEELYNDGK